MTGNHLGTKGLSGCGTIENNHVSRTMRCCLRRLREIRPFGRQNGWLLLWSVARGLILFVSTWLPSFLGLLVAAFLPLALIQLHILWVHTVIAKPSPDPFWKRLVPAKEALRVAGPPSLILFGAEIATQKIFFFAYSHMEMKEGDFFPMGGNNRNAVFITLLLAALTFVFIRSCPFLAGFLIWLSFLCLGSRSLVLAEPP